MDPKEEKGIPEGSDFVVAVLMKCLSNRECLEWLAIRDIDGASAEGWPEVVGDYEILCAAPKEARAQAPGLSVFRWIEVRRCCLDLGYSPARHRLHLSARLGEYDSPQGSERPAGLGAQRRLQRASGSLSDGELGSGLRQQRRMVRKVQAELLGIMDLAHALGAVDPDSRGRRLAAGQQSHRPLLLAADLAEMDRTGWQVSLVSVVRLLARL